MIHHGDCLEVLRTLPDNSVDAVVTDPPYGLAFMGKRWDYDVPAVEVWAECLRVLKPGGHLLAFAGTRTQHRMAVRIEDAGFEIRDMIAWVYGSGFPKSHNGPWGGTALKPALEPITVARKPLSGTVAENVLAWGTGGLNIDGCRVDAADAQEGRTRHGGGIIGNASSYELPDYKAPMPAGRWPANLIHDGSEEVLAGFPQGSFNKAGVFANGQPAGWSGGSNNIGRSGDATREVFGYGDTGSAARFFYCAKASKRDRDEGLDAFAVREAVSRHKFSGLPDQRMEREQKREGARNHHPTVKPTDLMRYLCRLVTPPGGMVLDPFAGSGSTGKACALEGFQFIGIEREAEYVEIARARIAAAQNLFSGEAA